MQNHAIPIKSRGSLSRSFLLDGDGQRFDALVFKEPIPAFFNDALPQRCFTDRDSGGEGFSPL